MCVWGGRGGSSGIVSPKVPTNTAQKNITDFIKNQTNVDVNKYRDDFTSRFEVKDGVLLYWKGKTCLKPRNRPYRILEIDMVIN